MKEKNRIFIAVLLVSIVIYLIFYYRGRDEKDLTQNGVIVQAKILKVLSPYKGGVYFSFLCEFEYKGALIQAHSSSKVSKNAYRYIGEVLPALYAKKSGSFQLLFDSDDFLEYGRRYPDGAKIH